jgi:hypothetical protein
MEPLASTGKDRCKKESQNHEQTLPRTQE